MVSEKETGPEVATPEPADTHGKSNTAGNIGHEAAATPPNWACQQAALSFAARGWSVIPIWWVLEDGRCACGSDGCDKPGKHPIAYYKGTPIAPQGFENATTDGATINKWWALTKGRANVAAVTGARSGIVVIDVDPKHGGFESLTVLEKNGKLETLTETTPSGGRHYFFKYPRPLNIPRDCSGNKLGRGVDILGNGGYVICAPSRRGDKRYEWIDADAPLAEMPAWLVEKCKDDPGVAPGSPAATIPDVLPLADIDALPITDDLRYLIRHGRREHMDPPYNSPSEARFAAIVELINCGVSAGQIVAILINPAYEIAASVLSKKGRARRFAEGEVQRALAKKAKTGSPSRDKADLLAEILGEAQLWRSDDAYATITRDGHREHLRIKSDAFKEWLSWRFFNKYSLAVGNDTLNTAIILAHGIAANTRERHVVWSRVGRHDGKIYLDLGDETWGAVEIDRNGWRIVDNPPCRFRRSANAKPLPVPVEGGSFEALRGVVNVKDATDWRMLLATLVGWMWPEGPFPIAILVGVAGAAKSTMLTILRSLVDPAKATRRSPPREEDDLVVQAAHNWVCSFDNISSLDANMSDAYCRLATGGGLGKRSLYTNDEEFVIEVKRPTLLTGINLPTQRQDFIDRAVVITLDMIAEDDRLAESELEPKVDAIRAEVLGAICHAVSVAIAQIDEVKKRVKKRPRMADFALWVEAAGPALWELPAGASTYFIDEYSETVRTALEDSAKNDVWCRAVIDLVNLAKGPLSGTAAQLDEQLRKHLEHNDAGKATLAGDRWPSGGHGFSRALARHAGGLLAAGIAYETKAPSGRSTIYTLLLLGRDR